MYIYSVRGFITRRECENFTEITSFKTTLPVSRKIFIIKLRTRKAKIGIQFLYRSRTLTVHKRETSQGRSQDFSKKGGSLF